MMQHKAVVHIYRTREAQPPVPLHVCAAIVTRLHKMRSKGCDGQGSHRVRAESTQTNANDDAKPQSVALG